MKRWIPFLLVLPFACGPGTRNTPGGGDDDTGDGGNGAGGSATGSDDGCSDDAKLIYVVDETNKLAKFDPMAKTFTSLGTLSCKTTTIGIPDGATPFSMAVDRSAQAYVLYSDGNVMKVDTTQAGLPCTATNWKPDSGGLDEFGMGYSTNMAGGTTDTLFIAGGANEGGSGTTSSTLAMLDTTAFTATTVGTISGSPELTGNSNAELWAFSPTGTPTVQQIDKVSGTAITTYSEPTLAGSPSAWAFGFYGGDYWVFLAKGNDTQSTVYEVAGPTNMSHTPGSIVGTTPATGLLIVGAGVSTCAPTMIF